ncbi:MAG: hypothetical protein CR977_00725 [Gammaproteobacteria bacterium]|nr:MAG: hypothetical protein CR977_00725 [Gammaproteobacteria bacterium]
MTMTSSTQSSINFYILPDSDEQNRLFFVFRLIEKAFDQRLPLLIIAADEAQLMHLNRLIWTAKPTRFIAHDIVTDQDLSTSANIWLTTQSALSQRLPCPPQVVIDLSYDATPLAFPKIMLITNQHVDILPNARMKYQAYVNQGITPKVYKISEKHLSFTDK